MPYIPPVYESLHQATSQLQQVFNEFSGRYVPLPFETLLDSVIHMEERYRQKVREKGNCFFSVWPDPVRLEEIACITYLALHMPETTEDTPERFQVHNILLGALLYRREIIQSSYSDTVSGKAMSIVGWSSDNSSALFRTLNEMLGMIRDRPKQIDALSMATCMRSYLHYLRDIKAVTGVSYIRDEPDFFAQLEGMVRIWEARSAGLVFQSKAILSLQSLAHHVHHMDGKVSVGLQALSTSLGAALSIKTPLLKADILAHLSETESLCVKQLINYLLPDDISVDVSYLPNFLSIMRARLFVNSQYVLLGAYVAVLNDLAAFHPDLSMTLQQALGALKPGNALDDDARYLGLMALHHYLDLPGLGFSFDFQSGVGAEAGAFVVKKQLRDLELLRDMTMPAVV